jgi:phosphotransferase system, enzyme I, PtsP
MTDRDPLVPTVHSRGERTRLDGILDLASFVARPTPLSTALDELPRRIASLLPCDVCSIYLLEGSELVMRGNVGFPSDALGEVRLAVGEGITGLSVECMRPMSLDAAASHTSYRRFPHLDEERFPIFMALPVAGPRGPLGALVLQRRTPPAFDAADLELAAALTAPIAAVAERARLSESARGATRGLDRHKGVGTRRLTLPGRSAVPGRAVGAACALRRPSTLARQEPARAPAASRRALEEVVSLSRRTLEDLVKRARPLQLEVSFLQQFLFILADFRLQQRVLDLVEGGRGMAHALSQVGAEATRAAARAADPFVADRAQAIDDVCEAMAMLTASEMPDVPRHAVLVGDRVTVFDLLVSARWEPAGVVLSDKGNPTAATLLALIGVPAIVDVSRLFSWVTDGDILLVDGDHGLVRVNPSRAEVALVRRERKRR